MLKFNTHRAKRYIRSRFVEGRYLLASESTNLELELIDLHRNFIKASIGDHAIDSAWKVELYRVQTQVTNKAGNLLTVDSSLLALVQAGDKVFKNGSLVTDVVSTGSGTITVTDATSINISDDIEVLTSNSLLVNSGEGWYDGIPFLMRGGKDHLVSGSNLAMGLRVVPGFGTPYITAQDDPDARGKIITFSDGGVTPTSGYSVVISAREEVITNVDDPFLKNANIPESTAQKLRLTYRLNVVPTSKINDKPIPYDDTTVDGNLTNYIEVIPQNLGNGSEVSRTVLSGSEQIDGRNLEIIVRNNAASANPLYSGSPVGNPIPVGTSEQSEFANGKFIDSLGREYHLNIIYNDTVANQVVIRIDKEVDQEDPTIIVGQPYRLVKRDVFVTDDVNGTPQGQLFWRVADVTWNATDGFVHETSVVDLRTQVKEAVDFEQYIVKKSNLKTVFTGSVSFETPTKASGSITVINNSFDLSDAVVINGKSFIYNVDWLAGGSTALTAAAIATAINNSTDPLIENVVTALAVGSTITITAVVGGVAGNSITLAEVDGATDNFTLSGATLTGGLAGTTGEMVWDSSFNVVNPHGVAQTVAAGDAVLQDGGSLAFEMDLFNGGAIQKGSVAVTTTSTGTSVSLSASADLSKVKIGNTILVGQDSSAIIAIDDVNKILVVSPALPSMGSAEIFLDTYAEGTLPVELDMFVLAVCKAGTVQIEGVGNLSSGESSSSSSSIPQQLLDYIGTPSELDDFPNYSSNFVINDGDSLTEAAGELDQFVEDLDLRLSQFKIEKHSSLTDRALVLGSDKNLLDAAVQASELSSYVVDFTGAVIDFASGTIYEDDEVTVLGNNFTPFSIPAGQYFWYGIGAFSNTTTPDNKMTILLEVTPAASAAISAGSAPLPLVIGARKIGAVQIYNDAGTLKIHNILRFSQAGSGSGSGSGFVKVDFYDPVSTTLPTGASPTIDNQTITENQLVFFTNLSSGNNRIYKATNVLTSVVWVVQKLFENSSETPFPGDVVRVKSGDTFANQVVYVDAFGSCTINDVTRFFDGPNGTDYWELSSLKTTTLVNNTVNGTVFSVNAAASENWIVNYSLNRAGIKEAGQIYITHDGTNVSVVTANAYLGASGVTFNGIISAGLLYLRYTITNTGNDASFKFYTQRWSDSAGGPGGIPNYSAYVSSVPAAGVTGDVQYKGSSGDLDADPYFKWDSAEKAINLNGYKIYAQQSDTLLDNQASPVAVITVPVAYKWMMVDYSLQRDGDTQVGTLFVTNNGVIASLSDSSLGTVLSLGVTFSADISGATMRVLYSTTATGFNSNFKYAVKRWA